MSEADAVSDERALSIGAAMLDERTHAGQQVSVDRPIRVAVKNSDKTAHEKLYAATDTSRGDVEVVARSRRKPSNMSRLQIVLL
jgi:hypothetical protein